MSVPEAGQPSWSASRTISVTSSWNLVRQVALSAGIVAAGVLTVRPLGWSGPGLRVALLLAVNSLFLFSRHLADGVVGVRARIVLLSLGGAASASRSPPC
jgi:hypothetical protein